MTYQPPYTVITGIIDLVNAVTGGSVLSRDVFFGASVNALQNAPVNMNIGRCYDGVN